MSTATHTDLITPTAAARKELPPERYQITRQAVIDQVAYHVACHNALVRAADAAKSNKSQLKLLGEAEDELGIAERTIEELESLASDADMDHVLEYLERVHHWAPRDIRPKKMERTPKQKRAGHTLETVPQEAVAPTTALTWDQVKAAVKAADRVSGWANKGTPNETLIVRQEGGSKGTGLLMFKYDTPADWKRQLITMQIPTVDAAGITVGDVLDNDAKQPKASTAPGPGEPARYFHPDKNLPYIHTHQLEPWIWVAKDGTCWLFEVPLAPGWTLKDNDHLGPLQVAPKGIASEAYYAQKRVPLALGAQPANGKIKMMVQRIKDREALKRDATNAANVTKKAIGSKLKKKLGHQAGDVLPDGTMVADPTAALLELHDQVNEVPLKVEAVPAGKTIEQLLPATPKWTPPDGAAAANLTDLAKPFGQDRRQREVVKKRFRSLYGKLSNMDAEERAAFLAFVNAKLQ